MKGRRYSEPGGFGLAAGRGTGQLMIETMGVVAAVLVLYTATVAYVFNIGNESAYLDKLSGLELECSSLESIVSAVHSCGHGCSTRFNARHDMRLYPGFAMIYDGDGEESFFCRVGDYTANASVSDGQEYEVENIEGTVWLK